MTKVEVLKVKRNAKNKYIKRQILYMGQKIIGYLGDDNGLCLMNIIKLLPRQANPFNPTNNHKFNTRKCLLLEVCVLWLSMDIFWKKPQLFGCKLELHCVCVVVHSNSHVSCKIMLILGTDDPNQYMILKSFWKLKLFPLIEFISYKCHKGITLKVLTWFKK